MDIKHILKEHAYQDIPLSYEEAFQLGSYVIEGCRGNELAQRQSVAALCALHNRATYVWKRDRYVEKLHGTKLPKNAAEQIAGICAAVFKNDIEQSEFNYLNPDVPFLMDNCGMGGDIIVTPNVSTIAAFIAAAAGINMCKHGSPSNADKGKYGSSDFISLICGINVFASKEQVENCVKKTGFGYTEALDTRYKLIHLQTHEYAMLPHMNDIIGPVTNPLNPKKLTRRVLGLNHLIPPRIAAEAYRIMNEQGITNLEHGLFVRGFANEHQYEGMDELSICRGGTQVAELRNGKIYEYVLSAEDFGIKEVAVEDISPKGNKGEFSLGVLRGEIDGPPLQMVLANSALLFFLAGKSNNLKECYKMAEDVHKSGLPYKTMLKVKEMLFAK